MIHRHCEVPADLPAEELGPHLCPVRRVRRQVRVAIVDAQPIACVGQVVE